LKAGYWAVVRRNKSVKNSFAPNSTKYVLCIKQKQKVVKVWSKEWKKVQYQGRIYSVKVPSGVILVRRDGKPCFSGNCHGWVDKGIYPSADVVKKIIDKCLREKKDPFLELQGKWHYDVRIQKVDASVWWGFTLFRLPLTGRPEDKILGTVKGYQSLVKSGKALQDFLRKKAQRIITSEGVKERMDRPEWMKIKKQMWPPGTLGSPTKQPGYMIAIESEEPAVLHRRELDFIDVTFLGKYLRGRYYYRLVERELSPDELTKEKRESGKKYYGLQFFFWRAKRCFDEKEMEQIAKLKKIKDPIPVAEQNKYTKVQKPLKGWKYKRKGKIYVT